MSEQTSMHRTQVYLTESEHKALKLLARRSGRTFAAMLREVIDTYIARHQVHGLREAIEASHGCWQDRGDQDAAVLRQEWETRTERWQK